MRNTGSAVRRLLLGLLVALGAGAGRAGAATVCGTLITNAVSADMSSGFPDFVAYVVSYSATATVKVLCPANIAFKKYVDWPEACIGTTVRFYVCVQNTMTDSVWGITLTDRLPDGMAFVDREAANTWNSGGNYYLPNSSLPPFAISWGGSIVPLMTNGSPAAGQYVPCYLRWTLDYLGPKRSACVTYRAVVL